MTDVLASYFDEASGHDKALRDGIEAIGAAADQPGRDPASPKFDEKLKQ